MRGRSITPQTPVALTSKVTLVTDEPHVPILGKLQDASSQHDKTIVSTLMTLQNHPSTPVLAQHDKTIVSTPMTLQPHRLAQHDKTIVSTPMTLQHHRSTPVLAQHDKTIVSTPMTLQHHRSTPVLAQNDKTIVSTPMTLQHHPTTPVLAQFEHAKSRSGVPKQCTSRSGDKARSRSRKPRTPREHKVPEEHCLPDTARILGDVDDSIVATTDKEAELISMEAADAMRCAHDLEHVQHCVFEEILALQEARALSLQPREEPCVRDLSFTKGSFCEDNLFRVADLPIPKRNFAAQDCFFDLPPAEKKPCKVVELPVILWQRPPAKQQASQPDLTSSAELGATKKHLKEIIPRTPTQVDLTDAPRLHMPAVVRDILSERNRILEAPRGCRTNMFSGMHCGSVAEDRSDMQVAQTWSLGDEDLVEAHPSARTPEESRQINQCFESITFVHEPQEHEKTHHLQSDFRIDQGGDETIAKALKAEHMDAASDLSTDDTSQQHQISSHSMDAGNSTTFHIPAEAYPANISSLVRSAVSFKNTSVVVERGAVRPAPLGRNSVRSQRLVVDPPQKPRLERENTDSTSLATWSEASVSSKATFDSSSSSSSLRSSSAKVPDAFARRYDRDNKMLRVYVGIASCCILMLIGVVLGVAFATVHAESESGEHTQRPIDGHSRLRRLYSRWSQLAIPSVRCSHLFDVAALLIAVFFSCCLSIGIIRFLSMGSYHKCDGACGRKAVDVANEASLTTWAHSGITLHILDRDGRGSIHSNCYSSSDTV